jgi:hypothetical protein
LDRLAMRKTFRAEAGGEQVMDAREMRARAMDVLIQGGFPRRRIEETEPCDTRGGNRWVGEGRSESVDLSFVA